MLSLHILNNLHNLHNLHILHNLHNLRTLLRLAIFASGAGSNARQIIEFFRSSPERKVVLIVSNKRQAGVLDIAREHGIPTYVIDRQAFYETQEVLSALREHQVDFIALAGFLWLIPTYLIQAFPRKIVNIHPALLPKFGGQGMYGLHVHTAVKAAGETETGMTIHLVDDHYDAGDIVFQARCPVGPEDTPTDIAQRVLVLEHAHYPIIIKRIMNYEL